MKKTFKTLLVTLFAICMLMTVAQASDVVMTVNGTEYTDHGTGWSAAVKLAKDGTRTTVKLFADWTASVFKMYNGIIEENYSAINGGGNYYKLSFGKQSAIISYDKVIRKTSVYITTPGKYTVIFADYEEGVLNKLDIAEHDFTEGINYVSPRTFNMGLGSDDKIMFWNNMDSFSPICEVFTLPKEEAPTSQS